jgi:hypothetical protein
MITSGINRARVSKGIQGRTGLELLALAVFAPDGKSHIDRELDRRAALRQSGVHHSQAFLTTLGKYRIRQSSAA